jgi:hypothetical protein
VKTADKLDTVIDTLDELLHVALNPVRYEELVRQEKKLSQILARAQLILSFLDTHEKRPVGG